MGAHESVLQIDAKLEADPDNQDLLFKKAGCLRELFHFEEALKILDRLIQGDEGVGRYYYERALVYRDQKAYEKALSDLDTVVGLEF